MNELTNERKVLIAFPGASAPKQIMSKATIWGDLKRELEEQADADFYNTKVRDFDTNHRYEEDDAILPTGELKLLVSTDKNKSGGITKANYHKAPFSDLRTFCKKMVGKAPNGKQACIDALDAHYGKTSPKVEAPKKAPAKTKTVKETIKAVKTAKKTKPTSIEDRVAALETAVFGTKTSSSDDDFLMAAKNLD